MDEADPGDRQPERREEDYPQFRFPVGSVEPKPAQLFLYLNGNTFAVLKCRLDVCCLLVRETNLVFGHSITISPLQPLSWEPGYGHDTAQPF